MWQACPTAVIRIDADRAEDESLLASSNSAQYFAALAYVWHQ